MAAKERKEHEDSHFLFVFSAIFRGNFMGYAKDAKMCLLNFCSR
jgi:hypothetical protein